MSDEQDKLEQLLSSGWAVVGYSTTIGAAGIITHSILLQKDNELIQATIGLAGEREIGRNFATISPKPPEKKSGGWFS